MCQSRVYLGWTGFPGTKPPDAGAAETRTIFLKRLIPQIYSILADEFLYNRVTIGHSIHLRQTGN